MIFPRVEEPKEDDGDFGGSPTCEYIIGFETDLLQGGIVSGGRGRLIVCRDHQSSGCGLTFTGLSGHLV